MKRVTVAALTGVALVLFNGVLPLASASDDSPVPIETTVVQSEGYEAPAVERDSFGVTEAPAPAWAPSAAATGRQPHEGTLSVKTCRAALNGYVVCIGG